MQTRPLYPNFSDGTISLRSALQRAAGLLIFVSDTAYLDAKLLLMKASGFTEVDLVLRAEEVLEERVAETFDAYVQRRLRAEPLAYIVGTKGFMGLDYEVGEGVLIPRPETELLVENLVRRLAKRGKEAPAAVERGLEIGLGSGIISLSLLKLLPGLIMEATDISARALEIAARNALKFGLQARLRAHRADIYEEHIGGNFDFLVSNPPYIAGEEYSSLDRSILHYEPKSALLAEEDGYSFYRRITALAPSLIKKGGLLAFEIGYNQAERVMGFMEEAGFVNIDRIKDYSQFDRVLIGERA